MSSWWRLAALAAGATSGPGSWKKRAAIAKLANDTAGDTWQRKITVHNGAASTHGSWERRFVASAVGVGPWARQINRVGL